MIIMRISVLYLRSLALLGRQIRLSGISQKFLAKNEGSTTFHANMLCSTEASAPRSCVSLPYIYFSPSLSSLRLKLVDFLADFSDVVEAIEERLAVDAHPGEEGLDFLVFVEDEACVDDGLLQEEADGFVMGDAVAESVDFVKLVENIRVVVLHLRRGACFVGEDAEQGAACHAVLHRREHVFPDAELEACKEFRVGIEIVGEQLVIGTVYDVVRLVQDGAGKRAAGHDGVFQPLRAHARGQLLVDGVA